jgi:hypothetical protein
MESYPQLSWTRFCLCDEVKETWDNLRGDKYPSVGTIQVRVDIKSIAKIKKQLEGTE